MRRWQPEIASSPRSSASTSSVVSLVDCRSAGSPKSGISAPGKPPTNPLVPTIADLDVAELEDRVLAVEHDDDRRPRAPP